jgi:hypothetical protein
VGGWADSRGGWIKARAGHANEHHAGYVRACAQGGDDGADERDGVDDERARAIEAEIANI